MSAYTCHKCQGPCDGALGINDGPICHGCAHKLYPANMRRLDSMCDNIRKGGLPDAVI